MRRILVAVLSLTACGDVRTLVVDAAQEPDIDAGAVVPDAATPGACEPGGDPTFDEAWACGYEAVCGVIGRCLRPYDSLEHCVATEPELFSGNERFTRALLRDAIEQGIVEYHPEAVAECVQFLAALDCMRIPVVQPRLADFCPIFTGTVEDDEDCVDSFECATPGARCSTVGLCQLGDVCCAHTCVAPAGVGEECGGDVNCLPGAYCVDGVCRTGAVGQPCFPGLCDPGNWCEDGTCIPEVEPGGDCYEDQQCPGNQTCIGDALEGTGECGESQAVDDTCEESCFAHACVHPGKGELGTCVAYGDDGDSCEAVGCKEGLFCSESSVCEPLADEGDPCVSGGDCLQHLFCDTEITGAESGSCTARQPDGEPCTSPAQCESGICGGDGEDECLPYPGCYE